MTRIRTLCCSIPRENAPQNEASPSVINNSGHVRGLEGSSYISLTTFQISKLFLDVNEHSALKRVATSMTRKLQTNTLLPDTLYVVFLHWDENQVYYKIEVYRLYGALHRDLSQFAVDSFLR